MKFAEELSAPTIAGHKKAALRQENAAAKDRTSTQDKSASCKTNLLISHRNSMLKLLGPMQLRDI